MGYLKPHAQQTKHIKCTRNIWWSSKLNPQQKKFHKLVKHHKFTISQNFNKINAKIIKQYVHAKINGFQNVKLTQKIYILFLYKGVVQMYH